MDYIVRCREDSPFFKIWRRSYLRLKNGKLKTIPMRLTPKMKITAIDPSKLKIESKVCGTKAHIVSHEDKSYYHLCQYDDGIRFPCNNIYTRHRVLNDITVTLSCEYLKQLRSNTYLRELFQVLHHQTILLCDDHRYK